METEIRTEMKCPPALDRSFTPASLWTRAYQGIVSKTKGAREVGICLIRGEGSVSVHRTMVLPDSPEYAAVNFTHVERLLKFLLWQKGGGSVLIAGAPELVKRLSAVYSPEGARRFDHAFIGKKVYCCKFEVGGCSLKELPAERESSLPLGRHLDGNRIGFDLGGSDRKCAAVVNGEVVFSEETPWSPYFEANPDYHYQGIMDTLKKAAAHLPRVDAIGGSAAGVYVNNEVRAASLFRGVSDKDFDARVRRMFHKIAEEWRVPLVVVNDGEVTALAGSMAMDDNSVLGISMGTSLAAGFITESGNITSWLNELAFTPVDYRHDAPADEWSGDIGCGVQYFSQQGVGRLAPKAGFEFTKETPLPERLVEVQKRMAAGDDRAAKIYETIGDCFGYALAHYHDFYSFRNLLLLGRVMSGEGGAIIIRRAEAVLKEEFPGIAGKVLIRTPDEREKRHGQAVAAASLPAI